jgi:hypothetical protein
MAIGIGWFCLMLQTGVSCLAGERDWLCGRSGIDQRGGGTARWNGIRIDAGRGGWEGSEVQGTSVRSNKKPQPELGSMKTYEVRLPNSHLANQRAAGEVVGESDLIQDGSEAVREANIYSWAAAVRSCLTAGEPMLIVHANTHIEAIGKLGVDASAESEEVITRSEASLVEAWGGIEGSASGRAPQIGVITAVGAVITDAVLKGGFLRGRMLADIDLVEVELCSPMGSEIKSGINAVAVGILRRVVRVGESEGPACLEVTSSGGVGGCLSQRKGRARSQHSEDEDSSFQRVVSM